MLPSPENPPLKQSYIFIHSFRSGNVKIPADHGGHPVPIADSKAFTDGREILSALVFNLAANRNEIDPRMTPNNKIISEPLN